MKNENGDEIYGTWINDRAHGMARICEEGESEFRNVVFKNDLMIKTPGSVGLSCWDIVYLIFAILFLLVFGGGIAYGLISTWYGFAAAGGAWFIY